VSLDVTLVKSVQPSVGWRTGYVCPILLALAPNRGQTDAPASRFPFKQADVKVNLLPPLAANLTFLPSQDYSSTSTQPE
jgi:hypothetical protein